MGPAAGSWYLSYYIATSMQKGTRIQSHSTPTDQWEIPYLRPPQVSAFLPNLCLIQHFYSSRTRYCVAIHLSKCLKLLSSYQRHVYLLRWALVQKNKSEVRPACHERGNQASDRSSGSKPWPWTAERSALPTTPIPSPNCSESSLWAWNHIPRTFSQNHL